MAQPPHVGCYFGDEISGLKAALLSTAATTHLPRSQARQECESAQSASSVEFRIENCHGIAHRLSTQQVMFTMDILARRTVPPSRRTPGIRGRWAALALILAFAGTTDLDGACPNLAPAFTVP